MDQDTAQDRLDAMRARHRMISARMSALHERAQGRRMSDDEGAEWAALDADLSAHTRAIARLTELVDGPRTIAQLQGRNAALLGRLDDIIAACDADARGMTELEAHVFDQARADAAIALAEIQRLEHQARMEAAEAFASGALRASLD